MTELIRDKAPDTHGSQGIDYSDLQLRVSTRNCAEDDVLAGECRLQGSPCEV
ncbi:hypothetical protein ACJQWK_07927 [Exserohilum turcicum]